MFRTNKINKEIQKICKKSILRNATKYHKNHIYINENIYDVNVMKIKNKKELITEVAVLKNWLNNQAFLIEKQASISTYGFNSEVDIILCDINFNVIKTYKGVKKNSNINCPIKTFNIWIVKVGFIEFYNIKENHYIALKALTL